MHLKSLITLSLTLGALATGGLSVAAAAQVSIHDPVMARDGADFYLFSTGPGITFYRSADLKTWKLAGRVFPGEPAWAKSVAPRFNGHLWAPDIAQHADSANQ